MLELTAETFDATISENQGLILVDFWAPWCGPCKAMTPIIEELSTEMTDVVFSKVNVDDNGDLAKKHDILSIPTFLLIKEGKVVEQFAGSMSKDQLKEKITSHLS